MENNNGNAYKQMMETYKNEFFECVDNQKIPAIGAAITRVAKEFAAHLLEREPVRLEEYLNILTTFLQGGYLKECHFFAKTRPKDWFAQEDIPTIKDYWDAQVELKEKLGSSIIMTRYIIVPRGDYIDDVRRDDLIENHNKNGIDLYFCDCDRIKSTDKEFHDSLFDGALYKDPGDNLWLIKAKNLDQNTVSQYKIDSSKVSITIMLESDQNVLRNYYSTRLKKLRGFAKKQEI